MFVKCVTKMDRQKFEQSCAIKFCENLCESATVTYEKLQRTYGEHSRIQGTSVQMAQVLFRRPRQVEDEPRVGRPSTSNTAKMWKV